MPMIIDGYNLLHAVVVTDEEWHDLGRAGLCREIEAFVGPAADVTVVFDGKWPERAGEEERLRGSVRATFAGAGREADAVIETLIARDSAPRRLLVVSSDRRIRDAARRRRARTLKSETFAEQMILRKLSPPRPLVREPAAKRKGIADPAEAVQWMAELGLLPDDGDDEEGTDFTPPPDMAFPWR